MCMEADSWEGKYKRLLGRMESLERRMLNFEIGNQPPKPREWWIVAGHAFESKESADNFNKGYMGKTPPIKTIEAITQ